MTSVSCKQVLQDAGGYLCKAQSACFFLFSRADSIQQTSSQDQEGAELVAMEQAARTGEQLDDVFLEEASMFFSTPTTHTTVSEDPLQASVESKDGTQKKAPKEHKESSKETHADSAELGPQQQMSCALVRRCLCCAHVHTSISSLQAPWLWIWKWNLASHAVG